MKLRRIRSGMSAANTSGIKKLKRTKFTPNNRPPRMSARFIRPPLSTYRFSHTITQEVAIPVNKHHSTVSNGFSSKEE